MTRNRQLSEYSGRELLNKKSRVEKSLKKTFLKLKNIVENSKDLLLEGTNKEYSRASSDYDKVYNNEAISLNELLSENEKINLEPYTSGYAKLVDIIEERNKEYLESIKVDIRSKLSPLELESRETLGAEEFNVPIVKSPRI